MKRIKLWHPPMASKQEPCAELSYGDVVFEIPCTMIHYISGWLVCGMKGSYVPVAKAFTDASEMLNYIEKKMLIDANPLTDEEIEFYKKHNLYHGEPEIDI